MKCDRSEGPVAPLLAAFDAMSCGGILLDGQGKVIRVNKCAKALLGDGLEIARGRVVATDRHANASLQALLLRALGSQSAGRSAALAVHRSVESPLVVRAVPLSSVEAGDGSGTEAKALVLILDPADCPEPSQACIREIFGLTSAEMRVAAKLMCGCSLQEIASAHRTEIGTVRQQLKAVLAKTQTRRQVELVALLTRLTMAFALHGSLAETGGSRSEAARNPERPERSPEP